MSSYTTKPFVLSIFLLTLSEIESGNNDHAIGKAGEVSRYQILPANWERHPGDYYAIQNASVTEYATIVVRCYLSWLSSRWFSAHGYDASTIELAWLYHRGPNIWRKTTIEKDTIAADYLQRFSNLYEKFYTQHHATQHSDTLPRPE